MIDPAAVVRGMLLGLAVVVPAGLLQAMLGSGSAFVWLLLGIILVGFGLAGAAAARGVEDRPLTHGALAAGAAFVVIQGINVMLRLGRGEEVTWIALPLLAMLCASCGLIGAWIAMWRAAGRGDTI